MKLDRKKASNVRRPRFEVLKFKVKRGDAGSSAEIVKKLNRLTSNQVLVYLKHDTLVGKWAYWTAIVENHGGYFR